MIDPEMKRAIARCDSEIAGMECYAGPPAHAWLTTLGIEDWKAEKRLLMLSMQYKCDQCGSLRGPSDNWYEVDMPYVDSGNAPVLTIRPLCNLNRQSSELHVCGDGCALKMISEKLELLQVDTSRQVRHMRDMRGRFMPTLPGE
jgi:hypothetical protein